MSTASSADDRRSSSSLVCSLFPFYFPSHKTPSTMSCKQGTFLQSSDSESGPEVVYQWGCPSQRLLDKYQWAAENVSTRAAPSATPSPITKPAPSDNPVLIAGSPLLLPAAKPLFSPNAVESSPSYRRQLCSSTSSLISSKTKNVKGTLDEWLEESAEIVYHTPVEDTSLSGLVVAETQGAALPGGRSDVIWQSFPRSSPGLPRTRCDFHAQRMRASVAWLGAKVIRGIPRSRELGVIEISA